MAELSWGKPAQSQPTPKISSQVKLFISVALLGLALVYLIASGMASGTRYFITVNELVREPQYIGQTVRISGAVLGNTIVYDSENLIIDFTIAHIPEQTTDLAATLHEVVADPTATRLSIHIENQVMPDLLQHEAQAIVSGILGEDGIFYANELLLKCPSRYEETVPEQVQPSSGA